MSDAEIDLIAAAEEGSLEKVKLALVDQQKINFNCRDVHGVTPLSHAAFKGHSQVCKFLIEAGADVNDDGHESGYTPLMFAALSGNLKCVQYVLDAGADPYKTNKINKTASQLASFVSQKEIVSLINNFVSKEEILEYTKPRYLETEARLPTECADAFHQLVLLNNPHPVNVCLFLEDHIELQNEKIWRLLEKFCEKNVKEKECDHVIAIKLHLFAQITKNEIEDGKFLKKLLARGTDESKPYLDGFIRKAVREFPYSDIILWQQMVRRLSQSSGLSGVEIFDETINGQRFGAFDEHRCWSCAKREADKRCGKCREARYCSQRCQKVDWFSHKKFCKPSA